MILDISFISLQTLSPIAHYLKPTLLKIMESKICHFWRQTQVNSVPPTLEAARSSIQIEGIFMIKFDSCNHMKISSKRLPKPKKKKFLSRFKRGVWTKTHLSWKFNGSFNSWIDAYLHTAQTITRKHTEKPILCSLNEQ